MKDLLSRLNAGAFEALDFGCGVGGSIDFARKKFGFESFVGVDLDPKKVDAARQAGVEVLQADATSVEIAARAVSASFMFHFLEHLPSLQDARRVITRACKASRDFVLIRQPFFGADEELFKFGLKLAWSTWKGHSNKMTTLDFYTILSSLRSSGVIREFQIFYAIPIESTADRQILPIAAETEALEYDRARHGEKPVFVLDGVYREVCVIVETERPIPFDTVAQASRVARRVYPLL